MADVISPRFSALATKQMFAMNLGYMDITLALKGHWAGGKVPSYNHIRCIINGQHFPSTKALQALCTILDLDYTEMDQLVKADRANHRGWTEAIIKTDPQKRKLDTIWSTLTPEGRKELLSHAAETLDTEVRG